MSAILEHFKPPPLASDPPAKTRYWPAPPVGTSGGILQRPGCETSAPTLSVSVSSTCPPMSRVSFAPLPDVAPRKRRNSITLGVAARSAALRRIKESRPPGALGPRQPNTAAHAGRNAYYVYPGQPRPRRLPRGDCKDDQVVDLGEVAVDAGKKLWRVINKKKSCKTSKASDPGPLYVEDPYTVGGPTVGVSGHNTEREILVRGFPIPGVSDMIDNEHESEDEECDEDEAQHWTEDYVPGIQAMQISDSSDSFPVDPSAVSPEAGWVPASLEPGHIHVTRLSPPPFCPQFESSDTGSTADSTPSGVATPTEQSLPLPAETGKDCLF